VRVQIHATNRYHPQRRMFDSATEAYADWEGEIDWPSVPPAGADWVHCPGWAVETLTKVYYHGPAPIVVEDAKDTYWSTFTTPIGIEVWTSREVILHLVEIHGFTMVEEA
jgi:hypothetical protein